jgi:diguanylate cyclase (GGDEF)-like protein/PAS domain S-box-containing protein
VLDSLATLTPRNPVVVIENRVFAAGGEIRWGQFVNRALFDDEGRLVEIQSVGRDITQRKQLEAQLAESARAVQDLYDNAPCGYYSLDPEGRFLRINAVALLWLGCTRAEAIGKLGPADFFTAEGRATFRSHFPKFKETGRLSGLEFDLVGRDGRTRRVSVSATAVFDERGEFVMSRSVMYDISELHAVRTELRRVTREQAAMLDNELVGMVKVRDRHIVWRNRAVERMFGYAPGELLGQPSRVLYFDDATHEAIGQAAYPTLRSGGRYRSQVRMARKGGDPIWIDVSGVLLSQETGESMWLMVDITLLRQHLEHVEHIAFHDLLTGLPNRALLDDRIGQAIHLCDRMGRMVAVCYLDLDGFKDVNDEFGHEAGDRLLKEVARRLQAGVRASDTVVRVGGDEFVLVLAPIEDHDECIGALHRVLTAVSAPIALDAHVSVQVTASIGGALYPRDAHAPDALVALADEAMYEAKRAGRNRVVCVGSKATEYVHAPDAAPAA